MLASEEASSPRLIVAASHTALSGDLGVLIIELQPAAVYRSTSLGPLLAITSPSEDADAVELAEGADGEDYGQIPLQEPLVLRYTYTHYNYMIQRIRKRICV